MNKIVLSTLALIIIFAGCANPCYDKHGILYDSDEVIANLNLKETFDEIATEMCGDLYSNAIVPSKNVLVTDFVDVSTLKSNESGMFMSELLKGSLNQKCNYSIQQAEFSKYFKLDRGGFLALTRNADEIKLSETPMGVSAVVGTFKYSPSSLHIFVREINIHSGKISKFVTKEIPFTCLGDSVIRTDFKIKIKTKD